MEFAPARLRCRCQLRHLLHANPVARISAMSELVVAVVVIGRKFMAISAAAAADKVGKIHQPGNDSIDASVVHSCEKQPPLAAR